jgi:thiamine transport system substrate-binding protein
MHRRKFLTGLGGAVGAALTGCLGRQGSASGSDVLRIATYESFVDTPSTEPGTWIKEEFESEFDATLEWFTPEGGLNYFIQRREAGVTIDADAYVGLNVDDLVRIDEQLGETSLLRPVEDGALANAEQIQSGLFFDPENRAIPFDTGYISLVYDERDVENPGTFDALLDPAYEGTMLAQNAQSSDPGRAFMLWTIDAKGPDGYLDYWRGLKDNDVSIFGSWNDAYGAYGEGEGSIVVSYSTDQVYAHDSEGVDMARHQVGFLNDQGYANPEGMAVFETTDQAELATDFLDWMLSKKVQSRIPILNVQFPATNNADPGEEFNQYAYRPEEAVTFDYDELANNLSTWTEDWAREIASG